eukprot:g63587.t1
MSPSSFLTPELLASVFSANPPSPRRNPDACPAGPEWDRPRASSFSSETTKVGSDTGHKELDEVPGLDPSRKRQQPKEGRQRPSIHHLKGRRHLPINPLMATIPHNSNPQPNTQSIKLPSPQPRQTKREYQGTIHLTEACTHPKTSPVRGLPNQHPEQDQSQMSPTLAPTQTQTSYRYRYLWFVCDPAVPRSVQSSCL